ncbi:MAG: DUF1501 domain-containing protein [Anaerolineae bacterium]
MAARRCAGGGFHAWRCRRGCPGWRSRLLSRARGDVLISIFLRGGADMLNMVVPHGEDAYYAARPKLAIPRPDDTSADSRVLDLDGFFGLHPALGALLPIFQGGEMLAVHAAGSPDETRSHFEAMDFMERGTPGEYTLASGWIGRHLATLNTGNTSPIRAVGWGTAVQAALRGSISPVAIKSIVDYHLNGDERVAAQMLASLNRLYSLESDSLTESARATESAIDILARVGYQNYQPRNGAVYPQTDFAMALRQTAALIRADVGLEAACLDLGGWDTHVNQGGAQGQQARLMTQLAEGLAAFHTDMADAMARVSVVVMSEFGRRVAENGGGGTDHGHGSALLVMGGNLAKQNVVANWLGLEGDALDRGEDLAITTDYRDVLAELLTLRLNNAAIPAIFPNFTATPVGVFRA